MTDFQRHTPDPGYAPADSRAEDRAMRAGDRSPEQIEREIEATRDRMSHSIDALGERLSPSRIKARAKEKVRHTGDKVGHVVRDNAVPIGLVGAGVTWMLLKRGDHSGPRDRRRYTNGYSGPERRVSDRSMTGLRSTVDRVTGSVGHAAGSVADTVSGAASSVADSVSGVASSVKEKTGDLARRAGELRGEAKDRARDMRARTRGSVERNIEENPLAVAAGAAVVGLALGLLFPATRRENRLMGATRDRLVDTTKETVRSVKETATESVKAEASERGEGLKQSARGIVDEVKEAAGTVAQDAKEAARETVRSRKNTPRL